MHSPPSQPQADRTVALALALFALAVYLTTTGLRFQSIDEIATFSTTRSLLGHLSFDSDLLLWVKATLGPGSVVAEGADGHAYTVKDVLPSLLLVPPVWASHWLRVSPVRAAFLLSPLISALSVGLLYLVVRAWGYRPTTGVLAGLAYGLASMAWPYSETLYTQPCGALGLLLATWGVTLAHRDGRWQAALLAGIGLGIAGTSVTTAWITLPIYGLYLLPWEELRGADWQQRLRRVGRQVVAFLAGAGMFVGLQALYNLARFGSPLQTGLQQLGGADFSLMYFGLGSFGQLFSTPRGLIWYAPFVLLVPLGVVMGWQNHRRQTALALAQVVVIFCLYSSFAKWWAGVSWGPRFLVVIMPALSLLIVPLLERITRPGARLAGMFTGGVLLISAATQALSTLLDPLDLEHEISDMLKTISPPPGFFVNAPILTNPAALPWVRLLKTMQLGHWDALWISSGRMDWLLLSIQLGVVALAGLWLSRAVVSFAGQAIRRAVFAQGAISLALVLFMLFRYPEGPNSVPDLDEFVARLSGQTERGDAIIALIPYNVIDWIDTYDSSTPDIGVIYEDPLSADTVSMLERASQAHSRLWLASEGTVNGNRANGVELWLAENGFAGMEAWVGNFRMIPYTFSANIGPLRPVQQVFGDDQIALDGYTYEVVRRPGGGWVNVWLRWEALQPIAKNYSVFVHLLDSNGVLAAQHDGWPMSAYAPTSSWLVGSPVDDHHSVALPPALPPGMYRLAVGLYDWTTGQRLVLADGSGDFLVLDEVQIRLVSSP